MQDHSKEYEAKSENENSRDGLDEYIRVSKPGMLVIIGALLILVAAVLIWGFVGKLPVTETVTGVVYNPQKLRDYGYKRDSVLNSDVEIKDETLVYCFVGASRFNGEAVRNFTDSVQLIMPDQSRFTGKIIDIFDLPISKAEAQEILLDNEWVTEQCVKQDYNWGIMIKPDQDIEQYEFMLTQVTLITEEVKPITFLLK